MNSTGIRFIGAVGTVYFVYLVYFVPVSERRYTEYTEYTPETLSIEKTEFCNRIRGERNDMKNENQAVKREISEEAKIARRAYYRMYRAKNRERIKETQQAYWERIAQKMQEGEAAK